MNQDRPSGFRWLALLLVLGVAGAGLIGGSRLAAQQQVHPPAGLDQSKPVFRSGVDVVALDVTVTDERGRFVRGLGKDDFVILEDGVERPVTHFTAERVPVSLGIVLDASESMSGKPMASARAALSRVLDELLDPQDETFLYQFSNEPILLQSWTTRRESIRDALRRVSTGGVTALYDATAEAVRFAATGRHRKKAVLVISDGNDTASHTGLAALGRLVQESDVIVYAIGIDAPHKVSAPGGQRFPIPGPSRFPPRGPRIPGIGGTGRGRPPIPDPIPPVDPSAPGRSWTEGGVDAASLRGMTDDTGGRTEVIRSAEDLDPATASIADELSRQYYLAYQPAAQRDGRWHTIELRVKNRDYHVRSRRGYVAAAADQR